PLRPASLCFDRSRSRTQCGCRRRFPASLAPCRLSTLAVGKTAEVIAPEQVGVTVEDGTADGIAQAIEELADDATLTQEPGRPERGAVERELPWTPWSLTGCANLGRHFRGRPGRAEQRIRSPRHPALGTNSPPLPVAFAEQPRAARRKLGKV